MWSTWLHAMRMGKMIQIRNVPDDLHRLLKARAATAGVSLSEFLLQELRPLAHRPTLHELEKRIASRSPIRLPRPSWELIRAERDSR
jgi:plasmid stability protein